ncbi:MAG: purine-nucleoside phosphorylase [Bacteroidota bacterium]
MSFHLDARPGEIAPQVLLAGDPLRAKFIAETYFQDVKAYNRTRNMLGFTGTYEGMPISVQGTGMGMPSMAIYVQELIREYKVKTLIRVGTCGALQPELALKQVLLATGAGTDSSMNKLVFKGMDFAPVADFGLMQAAWQAAAKLGIALKAGGVWSTDSFYDDFDPKSWKIWAQHGVLAVEMESSVLYTLAARHGVQAMSLLTVSDHMLHGTSSHNDDRERGFGDMVQIALEALKHLETE